MPPRAPTLKPLSTFGVALNPGVLKVCVVPGVFPGPVKWTDDVDSDWLVRDVQPPSGPMYQAHGVPVGHHADDCVDDGAYGCAYCAWAWVPPSATASAIPAPSRQRFVIPYLRPQYTCDDGRRATVAGSSPSRLAMANG